MSVFVVMLCICSNGVISHYTKDSASALLPLYISDALRDVMSSLQLTSLTVVHENGENKVDLDLVNLTATLHNEGISTIVFENNVTNTTTLPYFNYLSKSLDDYKTVTSLIFGTQRACEGLLDQLRTRNFIHRNLLFIFYWGNQLASDRFITSMHDAMRIAVMTNPRPKVFRLYYNQASPLPTRPLPLVNWWAGRLYATPALPSPDKVFANFQNRVFRVPVLHAPPWHFVKLFNETSIEVTGGRDHQLLSLLADKLNFRYEYFDPPDHSQGSGVTLNGSFKGVLGMIYRREADLFLGDVTMSWERQRGIEFSFLTLADSGAFVTHAPRRLSEALALLRPFQWEVWPAVILIMLVAGPALWISAAGSALWRPYRSPPPPGLSRCIWFTTSIFLRQSVCSPSHNTRARAVSLLLSLAATYVLGDVYSATLTSLLARPAREPPLSDLRGLEQAMIHRGYWLLVERHSSSLSILQNGTGVYGRLWKLMQRQKFYAVRSVEQGVRKILQKPSTPVVFLAGRETLYFDTRRFGVSNFQLSEKLYTRYSALALQDGCLYVENINRVLMQLFEAGILTKMTSEEYEKLGKTGLNGSFVSGGAGSGLSSGGPINGVDEIPPGSQTSQQNLEPINMRMLQGALYALIFGYMISGFTFLFELELKKRSLNNKKIRNRATSSIKKMGSHAKSLLGKVKRRIHLRWERAMELSQLSLDYIE